MLLSGRQANGGAQDGSKGMRAKRYRDGSPLERPTMDIEDAERHCSGSP
jgi:hypothetical protein